MTKQEAQEYLRKVLKPGDTVYTVLRHVSRSGMTRDIDCYAMIDNVPQWISYSVATACAMSFNSRRDAIRIGGCGMDMGFSIVYDLSRVLYRDAFKCIGEGCPANDHSNGDRDYTPHRHSDGGYALRHRWM